MSLQIVLRFLKLSNQRIQNYSNQLNGVTTVHQRDGQIDSRRSHTVIVFQIKISLKFPNKHVASRTICYLGHFKQFWFIDR